MAKFWCTRMGLSSLWWGDAFAGSCDLSTSNHEDSAGVGCETDGDWFYGSTLSFLWETCADSYGSAIRGFCNREIVLNFAIF